MKLLWQAGMLMFTIGAMCIVLGIVNYLISNTPLKEQVATYQLIAGSIATPIGALFLYLEKRRWRGIRPLSEEEIDELPQYFSEEEIREIVQHSLEEQDNKKPHSY